MSGPTTRSRMKLRASQHRPDEETNLESELSLPHAPMHIHINHKDGDDSDDTGNSRKRNDMRRASGLGRDKSNIAVLMFLYVLQGIPLGLAGSVPYLLQSRQVNYKDQALFSFVFWPFSVKLLWAPIVDGGVLQVIRETEVMAGSGAILDRDVHDVAVDEDKGFNGGR